MLAGFYLLWLLYDGEGEEVSSPSNLLRSVESVAHYLCQGTWKARRDEWEAE